MAIKKVSDAIIFLGYSIKISGIFLLSAILECNYFIIHLFFTIDIAKIVLYN